jgi:hypothetical protein
MGAVFALFGGFYYWAPKIIGKTYNDLLGKIHFWSMFIGVKIILSIWLTFHYLNFLISKFFLNIKISNPLMGSDSSFKSSLSSKQNSFIRSNIKQKSGVYMFYNEVNNKTYISSSVNLERRFRAHIHLSKT